MSSALSTQDFEGQGVWHVHKPRDEPGHQLCLVGVYCPQYCSLLQPLFSFLLCKSKDSVGLWRPDKSSMSQEHQCPEQLSAPRKPSQLPEHFTSFHLYLSHPAPFPGSLSLHCLLHLQKRHNDDKPLHGAAGISESNCIAVSVA